MTCEFVKPVEINYAAAAMDGYESLASIREQIEQKKKDLHILSKEAKDMKILIEESVKRLLPDPDMDFTISRNGTILKLSTFRGNVGLAAAFEPISIDEEV